MSREKKARAGAQAVIPDDTIIDVALTVPRGATMAGVMGAAVGGAIGQSTGASSSSAWVPMGMLVGEAIGADRAGLPRSIVLAASPTAVYALGRHRSGSFMGWKKLQPLMKIDRARLEVRHKRHFSYREISLVDSTSGATLTVEAQNIGNLGAKKFLDTVAP